MCLVICYWWSMWCVLWILLKWQCYIKTTPCKVTVALLQYIPRNMHTVFALLCFVVVIHWLIFPYPSGLLHWHCGNLTIAPVPAKQPWWIWINASCEFIMNDCITTTKQSTTKPCAYFLGYTVYSTWSIGDHIVLLYSMLWHLCNHKLRQALWEAWQPLWVLTLHYVPWDNMGTYPSTILNTQQCVYSAGT